MRTYQWFIAVLFAVALMVSGAAYPHDDDGRDGHDGWERHHGRECDAHHLPEAKMKLLHETMKASFEKDKALHEEAHKLHKELRKVMTSDRFDEKAFMSLHARLEDIHAHIQRDRLKAFASVAAQFSPEERKELMRMFHKHHHHHFGHDASRYHHEWRYDHESGQSDRSFVNGTSPQSQGTDNEYPPYSSR